MGWRGSPDNRTPHEFPWQTHSNTPHPQLPTVFASFPQVNVSRQRFRRPSVHKALHTEYGASRSVWERDLVVLAYALSFGLQLHLFDVCERNRDPRRHEYPIG